MRTVRRLGSRAGSLASDGLATLAARAHAALDGFAREHGEAQALGEAQQVRASGGWPGVMSGSPVDVAIQRWLPNATLGVTGLGDGVGAKTLRKCLPLGAPCLLLPLADNDPAPLQTTTTMGGSPLSTRR